MFSVKSDEDENTQEIKGSNSKMIMLKFYVNSRSFV